MWTLESACLVGARKQLPRSYAVLRMCPRIFGEVAESTRSSVVTTVQKLRIKGVFTPFCKGLGIYCNGFWGCGALGPHKYNQSDLSHAIKEVDIVEEEIPINTLYHRYIYA